MLILIWFELLSACYSSRTDACRKKLRLKKNEIDKNSLSLFQNTHTSFSLYSYCDYCSLLEKKNQMYF